MKDGTHKELQQEHKCGTCFWYNGELGDGEQFCDDKEIDVCDESPACYRWKVKY